MLSNPRIKLFSFLAIVIVLAVPGTSLGRPSASEASAQDEMSIAVQTLDCVDGNFRDVSTCQPIEGVPLAWTFTGYPAVGDPLYRDQQIRYTVGEGRDRLSVPVFDRVTVAIARGEPGVPERGDFLMAGFTIYPEVGGYVSFIFLLVKEELRLPGPATVHMRTVDCSATPDADPSTCPPLSGALFSQNHVVYGVPVSGLGFSDQNGDVFIDGYTTPSLIRYDFEISQACNEQRGKPDLVPTEATEWFYLLAGDSVEIVVKFVDRKDRPIAPQYVHEGFPVFIPRDIPGC